MSADEPLREMTALFAEAGLNVQPTSATSVDELQAVRLAFGRPALLSRLKEIGVGSITDRQKLAKCLAVASRAGRIPTTIPPAASSARATIHGKIAFCFLIYGEIHHEDLWHAFLCGAPRGAEQFSVHVHAKSRDVPLRRFEHCHLPRESIVETQYADISLVDAMNALLRHALAESDARKFVFVSGHCLPVKPFSFVYDALMADDSAHFC